MASQQVKTAHGFLALAPETSVPAASPSSTSSSPSLAPVDSSESLTTSVKNKRSPSTDSTSSTASVSGAVRRFLRLGHSQPEDAVVKGDFVEAEDFTIAYVPSIRLIWVTISGGMAATRKVISQDRTDISA
ncbi:Hypothetical protein D9617_16g013620 [Elsinoe fawcettii]|nr:Hypothetical protein D9617_16g013620 [Elsinoe fawcettii]